MRRLAAIALGLGMLATACAAEPRWCTITGRGPNDTLLYPPIGKAARVSGVVLGRVVFTPGGKVVRFEYVSGPRLLSNMVSGQLEQWTIRTDAVGEGLCQTLVIAEFHLHEPGASVPPSEIRSEPGSVLRLRADAAIIVLDAIGDPSPLRGFKAFRLETEWKIKRAFVKAFGSH